MIDTMLLSRIQFGANISFHILFPTITIALGWFLLYLKIKGNRTGEQYWAQAYQFWVKIFALTFALGVVSGIIWYQLAGLYGIRRQYCLTIIGIRGFNGLLFRGDLSGHHVIWC